MSSNTSNIVFDDIFTINAIDKEGKKFDRGTHFPVCLLALASHSPPLIPRQSRACTRTRKTTTWT